MKVLIVEDSEARKEFFREVLAENQLSFSSSSDAAIDLLKLEKFDLIFLDMDLDDGLAKGLAVARWLKETEDYYADVIVHSMNISVAAEVLRLLPGTRQLSFAEMRRIVKALGRDVLIERLFG